MIGLPGVAEEPAQSQPFQSGDRSDETNRIAAGIDSAAMKADVDFDQDVERPAARCIAADQPAATSGWSTISEIDARSISARIRGAFDG